MLGIQFSFVGLRLQCVGNSNTLCRMHEAHCAVRAMLGREQRASAKDEEFKEVL